MHVPSAAQTLWWCWQDDHCLLNIREDGSLGLDFSFDLIGFFISDLSVGLGDILQNLSRDRPGISRLTDHLFGGRGQSSKRRTRRCDVLQRHLNGRLLIDRTPTSMDFGGLKFTLPKTNLDPDNGPLEGCLTLPTSEFQGPC